MFGFTRREWLRGAACGAAGLVLTNTSGAKPKRPNFVIINVDDMAHNSMSNEGRFPFLKTPNMDRLAHEGGKFKNSFVVISLCSPSRACTLTGTYAHVNDVRVNDQYDPHPSLATYPGELQKAGYETAHIGKWHMNHKSDPRPGFDYWLSFGGQGRYFDPVLNEQGREFEAKGYVTDLLSDYAVNWIKQPRTKPFCLNFWHKAAHGPFEPAPRHKNAFAGAKMAEPPNFRDDFANKPEWMRRVYIYGGRREKFTANLDKPVPARIPPHDWDGGSKDVLDHLRCLLAVDDSVGRVLDALEETGELDNTFILFTADNGFFLGEHRRGDKRLAYEESMRVPLLIRYPRAIKPGSTYDPMVLNIDIAPTVLDLANAPIPDSFQGASLVPVLKKKHPKGWRESFFYEYFEESWLCGIPTMLAVRTKRWKYITCPEREGQIDELYDLKNDPIEMNNLALDPEYADVLSKMKVEMVRLKKELKYDNPVPPRVQVNLELILDYQLAQRTGAKVADQSGHGHDGIVRGELKPAGDNGLRFNGKGCVELAKQTEDFNLETKPFTVGVSCVPESPNGCVVSLGGQSNGFAVYLHNGVPHFVVNANQDRRIIKATQPVPMGQPLHMVGVLTGHPKMRLYVNGDKAAEEKIDLLLSAHPNESFKVGLDDATPVGDYETPIGWVGTIGHVGLYYGELDEAAIAGWK